jgi:hypothetical protein
MTCQIYQKRIGHGVISSPLARSLVQAESVRSQLLGIMERNDLDLVSLSDQRRLYANVKQALVCGFLLRLDTNRVKKEFM